MNDNEGAVTTRHMTTMHNTTVTITHDNYVKVHEGANTMTIERRKGAVERRRSAQGFATSFFFLFFTQKGFLKPLGTL